MSDSGLDGPVDHQGRPSAGDPRREEPVAESDPTWQSAFSDLVLSRMPAPGQPGDVPTGGDLRLDIGWDRFEQLLVSIARGFLGLHQVRFRRYGVAGQAQHGIDLAGRGPDRQYTVVQCKDYRIFTPAHLRTAVETFTTGKRPFNAQHLVIAVSTDVGTTQLEDELAALQDEHPDLRIELWGAKEFNDVLRERADIVSRFWTRETAETFCTSAPLPGVAAPPPDWLRIADQILLGPLGVDSADEQLAAADAQRADHPAAAAAAYHLLADALAADGFTGHAKVLRHRQLDALADAGEHAAVAALTAQLAATALHEADMDHAQSLSERLDALTSGRTHAAREDADEPTAWSTEGDQIALGQPEGALTATRWHAELIRAAVHLAQHPLGHGTALAAALRSTPAGTTAPDYQPLLVLFLAEMTVADAITAPPERSVMSETDTRTPPEAQPGESRLAALDDLITSALTQVTAARPAMVDKDTALRLRLLRASYDADERRDLVTRARQHRIPRPHAALALAAQARRDALDGSAEEALEHWRQAVAHAVHEGRTDDAAGWLYAVRAVHARYGPWTDNIDEEHLLAQALPKSASGRLIPRVRDPETDARRAALNNRPTPAILAARRWMADSIVIGDWVDEQVSAELLGDLYAGNAEPERAAACYLWAGKTKKLTELAATVGDRLLPFAPVGSGSWWQQATSLAGVAQQRDLLDDDTAGHLLGALLDLVARARTGEVIDSPFRNLTQQATKTLCALASRGSSADAQALLDLFADDVAREPNHYRYHDEEHVQACQAIAVHHSQLAWPALVRIFDLAELGTHDALSALRNDSVLDLLRQPPHDLQEASTGTADPPRFAGLTVVQRQRLHERLTAMAAEGHYEAGVAICALGGTDPAVMERARHARDRLLNRSDPTGHEFYFGTRMVSDAYLVTFLDLADQQACLEKMLTVAADRREAAQNRQEALWAAANLVLDQSGEIKTSVHARSRAFADGDQDGSALDDQTTNPHPLSAVKVDLGSATLRAAGLRLAQCSAVTEEDKAWVRQRAVSMLGDTDEHLVRRSAVTLAGLGAVVTGDLDATLLAGHHLPVVRQLATVIAAAEPLRYARTLRALATDADSKVRTLLAQRLHETVAHVAGSSRSADRDGEDHSAVHAITTEVLAVLATDARHSVRRAAAGLAS